jgi:hypothetical protein
VSYTIQRTALLFLIVASLTISGIAAPHSQLAQAEFRAAPQGRLDATAGAQPDAVDSLVVPDGTPLFIKVANDF